MSLISASTNENLTITDSADNDMLLEDASETYSSLNVKSVQSQRWQDFNL